ncbi:MAG TPA: SCO family protein [Streptosporangiaceae bacterium]|nr:SCO family protein [Streptosporangiaceae bacterium]
MHSRLNLSNPVLVAAFRSALMHQGLTALLALATLAIIWACLREWRPGLIGYGGQGRSGRTGTGQAGETGGQGEAGRPPEAAARRLLRLSFGLLWIFDGILQAQPAMAAGLPGKVIAPAAATSPGWVRELVNWAGTAWSYHPVQASAAAVWIQVGIGIWMLAASRGPWSRLAGAAGVAWGLVVWVFGEAFGGVLAPGLTVLFGAPGAALFYCLAGVLVALPDQSWRSPALGRRLLAVIGTFFLAMALLQAWPGRGFWPGTAHGQPGTLTGMAANMAGTPQPSGLSGPVRDFASVTASHGFGVNAFAVGALAIIGIGLVSQRRELLLPVVIASAVLCLADWVLVEDLGFLGGLGTDPNSMIPLLLLIAGGYVAVTRTAPAPATEPAAQLSPDGVAASQPDATHPAARRLSWPAWRERLRPAGLAGRFASASAQGILAVWAGAVVLLGAAPMALAQASPNADPIIARALGVSSAPLDVPAASFQLTDQNGRPVSLASLRGKVVLLTFLDPVCTTDCPLIAQELRVADQMLGAKAANVEIVAIAANPLYSTRGYLRAFDRRERLTGERNWLYLTGSLSQLRKVWASYGIAVEVLPGGQMIGHNDLVFAIDAAGHIRAEINSDPGAGTASSTSSFAVEFTQTAEQALARSGSSS